MAISLKVYSYSRCGTCRKALRWLEDNQISYTLIDIINAPPSRKDIVQAIDQLGDIKYLLNTSGKSYREIGAASIKQMSESKVVDLICSDSKLIKRPFVKNMYGKVIVGFNKTNWENFFLS